MYNFKKGTALRTEFAPKVAGTSRIQGILWSARAHDWAETQEGMCHPLFVSVLTRVGVQPGVAHLDIGCGAGRVSNLSAKMGATVSGLDASPTFISIAKLRTPEGDFRIGEMEDLPFANSSFDLVTGFNSFQFASSHVHALREARRVSRPDGVIVAATWGRSEQCETAPVLAALKPLAPPSPPGAPGPFALSDDGALEDLLLKSGLKPIANEEVICVWTYPELSAALRGLLSAGPAVAAIEHSGEGVVRQTVTEAIAPFRRPDGSYRMDNRFRYVVARN